MACDGAAVLACVAPAVFVCAGAIVFACVEPAMFVCVEAMVLVRVAGLAVRAGCAVCVIASWEEPEPSGRETAAFAGWPPLFFT